MSLLPHQSVSPADDCPDCLVRTKALVLVNIIPLIAKADTMTPDECDDFKKEILREIETHKINIYEFPDHDDEEENRFVHGSE